MSAHISKEGTREVWCGAVGVRLDRVMVGKIGAIRYYSDNEYFVLKNKSLILVIILLLDDFNSWFESERILLTQKIVP